MRPFRKQLHIIRMRAQDAGLVGIRKRRPHPHGGGRMRAFGVARSRYLVFIPLLLAAIALVAWIKTPELVQTRYRPLRRAVNNPLTGWAVDATVQPDLVEIEHSLVHATLTWRELEGEQGAYDFEAFESKNRIAEWRALGKRVVLRFVMDLPGAEPHMDIPDWLYEAMGDEPGVPYDTGAGKGFSPDYGNAYLQQRHSDAVARIGERYNGDPLVAFVELGSLGHNGEWWVDREGGVPALPLFDVAQDYIGAYSYAFPDTTMLAVNPYRSVRLIGAGLYNPFLSDAEKTWNWIDMATYGGYEDQIGTDLRGMGEFYRSVPSGAGFNGQAAAESLISTAPERLIDLIRECHTTYIGGAPAAGLSERMLAGMRVAQELMGYRLWVRFAQWPESVRRGESFRIHLLIRNSGVAPMSQAWPLQLSLHRDGEQVYSRLSRVDVRSFQPGESRVDLDIDVPIALEPGRYQIGLSILDPVTMEPAVELAMVTKKEGFISMLGELRVVR